MVILLLLHYGHHVQLALLVVGQRVVEQQIDDLTNEAGCRENQRQLVRRNSAERERPTLVLVARYPVDSVLLCDVFKRDRHSQAPAAAAGEFE